MNLNKLLAGIKTASLAIDAMESQGINVDHAVGIKSKNSQARVIQTLLTGISGLVQSAPPLPSVSSPSVQKKKSPKKLKVKKKEPFP